MWEEGGPEGRRNSSGQGAARRASVGSLRTPSGQPKRRSRRGRRRRGRQQPRTARDAKRPAKEQIADWRRGLWGLPGGVPWEPGKGTSEGRGRRGGDPSSRSARPRPRPTPASPRFLLAPGTSALHPRTHAPAPQRPRVPSAPGPRKLSW